VKAINRVKNSCSAANAKPKAVVLRHGHHSALAWARLDRRSREHKYITTHAAALVQHLGGVDEITLPIGELVEQAARLRLLEAVAWAEVVKGGLIINGVASAAYEAFLKLSARRTDLLVTLGLERKARRVPT
jgi:hypothetical protein